jgi:Spy/CpxP family protein refolding chaperone
MNTLKGLLFALALAAGGTTPLMSAEPAPAPDATEEHGEKSDKAPRVRRIDRLATELGLTEEQKTLIAAIQKEENAALKTVSEDKFLERAAKIARNREIRDAHAAKVRALLTPEQQVKFDALLTTPAGKKSGDKKSPDKH